MLCSRRSSWASYFGSTQKQYCTLYIVINSNCHHNVHSRVFILHTILLSFLIKNCNISSINVSPKSTWIKGAHNIKISSIFSDYTLKTVAKINLSNILILFHNYLIIKPLRISISFIHHVSKTTRYRQI